MKNTDVKFITAWEKHLEKGKLTFVIKNAIFWGIWMFLVMELFEYFQKINEDPKTYVSYLFSISYWLLGGIGFGFIMWFIQNRRYKKLKKTEAIS